jgi:hypothetical protein
MAESEKQAFPKQSNPGGQRMPDAPNVTATGSAGAGGGWQVQTTGGLVANRNDPKAKGQRVPPPSKARR